MEKSLKQTETQIKWHGIVQAGVRIMNQNWISKGYNDGYKCMRVIKGSEHTFNVYCEISASVLKKTFIQMLCRE